MVALAPYLLNPLLLFWALAAGWALMRWSGRPRAARRWGVAAAVWLFVITSSPLPLWLVYRLESRYIPLDPATVSAGTSAGIHIVVLGGGQTHAPGLTAADRLSDEALGRLVEGVRLYHRLPGSRLVFTGHAPGEGPSQAETLAEAALDLGVAPADTLLLSRPDQTREEAAAYRAAWGERYRVVLVTSAIHMPRAAGWFAREGIAVIPAPARYWVRMPAREIIGQWLPSPSRIGLMQRALHEHLGLWLQAGGGR